MLLLSSFQPLLRGKQRKFKVPLLCQQFYDMISVVPLYLDFKLCTYGIMSKILAGYYLSDCCTPMLRELVSTEIAQIH